MIEIRNLTKTFEKKTILEDVSLTVEDGAIFGLVGINGAGKSTLLRLAAGVLRPNSGEVLADGVPVFDNPAAKKNIFFLPDDPYWEHGSTGNSLASLYSVYYPVDRQTFEKYLSLFEISPAKPVRNFSKGMKRQLFISLAYACRPRYLLLDEAFDGLDPLSRLKCKRGLIELQESGTSVLISSHSLRELEDICDSFAILDNRKICNYGTLDDTLASVVKVQIVFNSDAAVREDFSFPLLSFEKSGRVVRIAARGDREKILAEIDAMHPVLREEIPIDFEDYFLLTAGKKEEEK